MNIFNRQFDSFRDVQKHYGFGYSISGNVNRYAARYLISIDEACELYILKVHHGLASEINCHIDKGGTTEFTRKKRRTSKQDCRRPVMRGVSVQDIINDAVRFKTISAWWNASPTIFEAARRKRMLGACEEQIKLAHPPKQTLSRKKRSERGYLSSLRHIARAKKLGAIYVSGITAASLAERDGYVCKVCNQAVERHLGVGYQPRGWSVGHIIPMSKGGNHTWENVQCECMECNSLKGDKMTYHATQDMTSTGTVCPSETA